MTDYMEDTFIITCISGLDTGDLWGVPDSPRPAGVLRSILTSRNARVTLIVDYAYAETMIAGIEALGAGITLGSSAIRWMRLGWPDEWSAAYAPDAWHPCVDGHVADLWDGDGE